MPARGAPHGQACLGGEGGQQSWESVRLAEVRAAETGGTVQFQWVPGVSLILAPAMVRGRYYGAVLAGPFATHRLDVCTLQGLKRELAEHGPPTGARDLRTEWCHCPIVGAKRLRAVTRMMVLFARYLGGRIERLSPAGLGSKAPLLSKVEALLPAQGSGVTVSLREVAARLSLSPCHFCRVFKQQTGMTLTQYQTQRRVQLAKQLLLQPERRVSEVAFEAGFESIPHFNRVFRRYVGCSPSEYRRGNGAQIQVK